MLLVQWKQPQVNFEPVKLYSNLCTRDPNVRTRNVCVRHASDFVIVSLEKIGIS